MSCSIRSTRVPDFDDDSRRPRTRASPIRSISFPTRRKLVAPATRSNIVMLTCDAFGVLPPIAKLDARAGDVSLPLRLHGKGRRHRKGRDRAGGDLLDMLRPSRSCRCIRRSYGNLLRDLIARHHVDCWLVNTGLDRRSPGCRPAHADLRHATPAVQPRSTALSIQCAFPHRSLFWAGRTGPPFPASSRTSSTR